MTALLWILAAIQVVGTAGQTIPVGEVERADPVVLAPKVLPASTASLVSGGWVRRLWTPGGQIYRALFWERSAPHGDRFCTRRVHVVELANRDAPANNVPPDTPLTLRPLESGVQYAPAYPHPATAERCAELKGYIAGGAIAAQTQLRMVDRLTEAMAAAAGPDPLPFRLSCTGEDPEACADARQALASLPLDALLDVRRPHRNELEPEERRPDGPRLYVEPRQDGAWEAARFDFDATRPNWKSWTVILQGGSRIESVEMRRSTIIRH